MWSFQLWIAETCWLCRYRCEASRVVEPEVDALLVGSAEVSFLLRLLVLLDAMLSVSILLFALVVLRLR